MCSYTPYVAKADSGRLILKLPSPKCWNDKQVLLCPACLHNFISNRC